MFAHRCATFFFTTTPTAVRRKVRRPYCSSSRPSSFAYPSHEPRIFLFKGPGSRRIPPATLKKNKTPLRGSAHAVLLLPGFWECSSFAFLPATYSPLPPFYLFTTRVARSPCITSDLVSTVTRRIFPGDGSWFPQRNTLAQAHQKVPSLSVDVPPDPQFLWSPPPIALWSTPCQFLPFFYHRIVMTN